MFRVILKAFGLGWLLPAPFKTMDVNTIHQMQKAGEITLIDVRKHDEWLKIGTPEGSNTLTLSNVRFLEQVLELVEQDKNQTIALSCHAGNRSKEAAQMLAQAGFKNLISVEGGIVAWKNANLPLANQSLPK